MVKTLWVSGALPILSAAVLIVSHGARLAAQDAETVRRRILLPDFAQVQPSSVKARPVADLALKLRLQLEESDRFTIIDQKLLLKLRPALKVMPTGVDDWAKLAEELNCENVVIGSTVYGSQSTRVQVGVFESVTRAEVFALQADVPAGTQGGKATDQLIADVSQQMREKLEPLDTGEVWREMTLEAQLTKIEDEYYRPKRAARAAKRQQEKARAEKLAQKRYEDERRRMLVKLDQQRKQRLKEIEIEKKRVAEMRARNPNYETTTGGELARVAIFDFADQTGSSDYQYLSGSLAGGVDVAMKARFNYLLVDSENTAKVKAESLKDGWLAEADAENVAKQAGAEILISGVYSIVPGQNQLRIRTVIYIQPTGEMLALPDFSNAIDGTLFEATDLISAQIVQKIMELARSQMGAKPGDPQAKVTLKRAITTGWPTKSWEIGPQSSWEFMGGGQQIAKGETSFLTLRFFPGEKAALRLGIFGGISLLPVETNNTNWNGSVPAAAGAEFGYQWFLSPRWKAFADFAPRYDFASARSTGGLVAALRGGVSFLIFRHLALEIAVDAGYYTYVSKMGYGAGFGVKFPF